MSIVANLYIARVVLEDQSACVKEEEAELRLGFSCDKNMALPLGSAMFLSHVFGY